MEVLETSDHTNSCSVPAWGLAQASAPSAHTVASCLTFTITPGGRFHAQLADEETEAQRGQRFAQGHTVVSGKAKISTQVSLLIAFVRYPHQYLQSCPLSPRSRASPHRYVSVSAASPCLQEMLPCEF